ncbi:MAG: aminotransferase class I/II-fold pyridoxal phosphate-dependent enzyme, partial [Proteobacteria bacterium]|nr:aminotransferase class I/II-fold pyridoxal phosphate-dependent enzyme [Pseudomonadota bacterium]
MSTDQTVAPSTLAMNRFLANAPGLSEPRVAVSIPGLPTLPGLKLLARERMAQGFEVIDQSAGDIADVNQPMSEDFTAWIDEVRSQMAAKGIAQYAATNHTPYGYPGNYIQQFPLVVDKLWESWGARKTACVGIQTNSGRTILDFAFRGLMARIVDINPNAQRALILDPIAWSGYKPLARDLNLKLINSPVMPGHGLASSAEGLRASVAFAKSQGLQPIGMVPIIPSNPAGVGMERGHLKELVEAGAELDIPVMIDAFYSPLAPEGHPTAIPLSFLEDVLTPEVLAYLGVIVGETKVVSSQNKTGSLLWFGPEGQRAIAEKVVGTAKQRMCTTNAYPRPQEALVAYALHTFPDGI